MIFYNDTGKRSLHRNSGICIQVFWVLVCPGNKILSLLRKKKDSLFVQLLMLGVRNLEKSRLRLQGRKKERGSDRRSKGGRKEGRGGKKKTLREQKMEREGRS